MSRIVIIVFLTISGNLFAADRLKCVIKGTCLDFTAKEVTISRSTVDMRYHGVRIPIVDGKFEYVINAPFSEAYSLVIMNSETRNWHNASLFSENGTIELIFSEEKKPIVEIHASKKNALYDHYKANYGNARKNGFMIDGKSQSSVLWKCNYIDDNLNEISYFLLISELRSGLKIDSKEEIEALTLAYDKLSKAMPTHVYTSQGYELVRGLNNIRIGGTFVDVTANDLSGESFTVSEVIKGKVAIIDLWASWCKPCREKSLKLKPIYEEYKSKGFEVVGIAREFKNTDRLKAAIKQDGYVWLNLVELDDNQSIWDKYMIGNRGGCVFMVDAKGKILFINPTTEQVKAKLKELL